MNRRPGEINALKRRERLMRPYWRENPEAARPISRKRHPLDCGKAGCQCCKPSARFGDYKRKKAEIILD